MSEESKVVDPKIKLKVIEDMKAADRAEKSVKIFTAKVVCVSFAIGGVCGAVIVHKLSK